MKKLLFALLTIFAFAACDNTSLESEENTKAIIITNGSTTQTLFADQTQLGGGITFTTTGAWSATVTDRTATKAEKWVNLSQIEGDKAGEYTLDITLTKNTTGTDRKAEIDITCGTTKVTIDLTQKATNEDGSKPEESKLRLISKIEAHCIDYFSSYTKEEWTDIQQFTYDSANRLIGVKEILDGTPESQFIKLYSWEYADSIVKLIEKTTEVYYQDTYSSTETYTFALNADGSVKKADISEEESTNGTAGDAKSWSESFTYENGYLTQKEEFGKEAYAYRIKWLDGNLIKRNDDDTESYYIEYTYAAEPYDKQTNINFSPLFDMELESATLNFGHRNKSLCKQAKEYSSFGSGDNKLTDITTYDYSYEYDSTGYVTKIKESVFNTDNVLLTESTYTITYVE